MSGSNGASAAAVAGSRNRMPAHPFASEENSARLKYLIKNGTSRKLEKSGFTKCLIGIVKRKYSSDSADIAEEADIKKRVLALSLEERLSIAHIAKRLDISHSSAYGIIDGHDPLVERLRELGDMLRGAAYHPLRHASRYNLPMSEIPEIVEYENLRQFFRRGHKTKKQ